MIMGDIAPGVKVLTEPADPASNQQRQGMHLKHVRNVDANPSVIKPDGDSLAEIDSFWPGGRPCKSTLFTLSAYGDLAIVHFVVWLSRSMMPLKLKTF